MAPDEFRSIRLALGLTLEQWGQALGYQGPSIRQTVSNMEAGRKPISRQIALLAAMYQKHGLLS
jgi:transcriptional regulator with XRE-family HTH domain